MNYITYQEIRNERKIYVLILRKQCVGGGLSITTGGENYITNQEIRNEWKNVVGGWSNTTDGEIFFR